MPVTLVNTAAVLVIERRVCRGCGMIFDAPSPNLHVYSVSPRGHSPARAIQRVPNRIEETIGIADLRRSVYVEVREVPACYCCWDPTITFDRLEREPPPPPSAVVSTEPPIKVIREPRLEDL